MSPKKTMEETVELMLSSLESDQLLAEYYQLENRLIALNQELLEWDLNPANIDQPQITRNLMSDRMSSMRNYMIALQRQLKNKGIEIT